MICVKVHQKRDDIREIVISGHADSATETMDVVCAEVSAIGVGALNSIDILCHNTCDMDMDKGYIHIKIRESNAKLQTILHTIVIQLETVEYTNKEYIQVKKVEV